MAAVLACGAGAVLSHRSAAALWGIAPRWRGPVDVTTPTKKDHRGITTHRSQTLTSHDVTIHYGVPTTTLARTVLDLTDVLTDKALARAVNEARLKGLSTLGDVRAAPGRATTRLDPFVDKQGPTRSTFEDEFLEFCTRYGLPLPEMNQEIAGHEADAVWREQRLIVELDSRTHHGHLAAFENDRDRDVDTLVAGFRTVRVTWARLTTTPAREAARLGSLLDVRVALERR